MSDATNPTRSAKVAGALGSTTSSTLNPVSGLAIMTINDTNLHGSVVNINSVVLGSGDSGIGCLLELDSSNSTGLSIGAVGENCPLDRTDNRLEILL